MKKLIKEKLDEYLEFDSNKIFNKTDYLVVFGGALRDIVAGDSDKIKDIDIMCLPKSKKIATNILLSEGYKKYGLFTPDIFLLYANIKCIFEPKTFIKGDKIVQLITPTTQLSSRYDNSFNILKSNFFNILSNVDLSSSGLIFDGEELYESISNATEHCKRKIFKILTDTKMYNKDRITIRTLNLFEKNWEKLDENDILMVRLEKILKIKNKNLTIRDFKNKLLTNEIQKR